MRLIHTPLDGLVLAAEPKDFAALTRLGTTLQRQWREDIVVRFDADGPLGQYAFAAEIYVYRFTSARRDAKACRHPLLLPGIAYGSGLWEPMVDELKRRIAAAGFQGLYSLGASGNELSAEMRAVVACGVSVLREELCTR